VSDKVEKRIEPDIWMDDYKITYFQCYLSVLHGVLSFCLVWWEIRKDGWKTARACDT